MNHIQLQNFDRLFHLLVKKQYHNSDLNLMLIWKKQDVPNLIKDKLLEIAKKV